MKPTVCGLQIQYIQPGELTPNPRNARTHTRSQRRKIAASIRKFGFLSPIIADNCGRIIAGQGRWEAAKEEGLDVVPVIRIEHLTDDQVRAYIIADNKLAELAGWDRSLLAIELQHLVELADFEVEVTGFDVPEIDLILQNAAKSSHEDDDLGSVPAGGAVTRPGDFWELGRHCLGCADARNPSAYQVLMKQEKAALVFADLPYNVRVNGHVSGKGRVHHREFPMAAGEMDDDEYIAFLTTVFTRSCQFSSPGSLHYHWMDWRHARHILEAAKPIYGALVNLCVWVKDNAGMGSFYRSQHELVFIFENGTRSHRNNVQLGRYGRNRTNVWHYPRDNAFGHAGDEGNLAALHPTVKPVQMVVDAILDASARGDIVLDPFLGSGTTLIAAERTGRTCRGLELDPLYVDLAIRRWQRHTGEHAVHAATGRRFDDAAAPEDQS